MITNKNLDVLQAYAIYYHHFLKDSNVKNFEDLKDKLFNDKYFYGYIKKISSEAKLDSNDFSFDYLSKVVLNYVGGAVLSKSIFFKRLDKIEDKENFISGLNKDISYIFDVLGSKQNGLNTIIKEYQDYINNQSSVFINVKVTDYDNFTRIVFKSLSNLNSVDFENRIEAYNFLKVFHEDIKRIDFSFKLLHKYLDIKMFFREKFVMKFGLKKSKKIFSFSFDSVENIIAFSNELFSIYSLLKKINKGSRGFFIEFSQEEKMVKLIEKGLINTITLENGTYKKNENNIVIGDYGVIKEEIFFNLRDLKENMGEKNEEIKEFFI